MKKKILLCTTLIIASLVFIEHSSHIPHAFGIRTQSGLSAYEYENILCEKMNISSSEAPFWCNADFLHTHTFLGSDEEKLVFEVSRKDDMLYAYLTEHIDRSWHFVFVKKGMRIGKVRYTAIKEPVCETKMSIRSLAKTKTTFDDFYVVFKKR